VAYSSMLLCFTSQIEIQKTNSKQGDTGGDFKLPEDGHFVRIHYLGLESFLIHVLNLVMGTPCSSPKRNQHRFNHLLHEKLQHRRDVQRQREWWPLRRPRAPSRPRQ
jgi:hypothetical protein